MHLFDDASHHRRRHLAKQAMMHRSRFENSEKSTAVQVKSLFYQHGSELFSNCRKIHLEEEEEDEGACHQICFEQL